MPGTGQDEGCSTCECITMAASAQRVNVCCRNEWEPVFWVMQAGAAQAGFRLPLTHVDLTHPSTSMVQGLPVAIRNVNLNSLVPGNLVE